MTRSITPHVAQPTAPPKVTHDRIAMRAYEKWMQGGCQHGRDQQDWLEAETELTTEVSRPAAAPARTATPGHSAAPAPQPAPAARRR